MNKILAITFFILLGLFSAGQLFANGGDQRVVEGKYMINLSRAPFTPRVGVKTSFLASFVDLKTNNLVQEDLIVKVRISKLEKDREFIFEQENIKVQGGVLELPHTFNEIGIHEIFFDFAFTSNPQKVYEAPDFLLDVQKQLNGYNINQILLAIFGSFAIGLTVGWFVKRIVSGKVG